MPPWEIAQGAPPATQQVGYSQLPPMAPVPMAGAAPGMATFNSGMAQMPPGVGVNYQPYPGIDMYRYGLNQTINEDGLWFQKLRNQRREYTASFEYLSVEMADPGNDIFGYDGAETGVYASDGVVPFVVSMPRTSDDNDPTVPETIRPFFKPAKFNNMFDDGLESSGFKVRFGWTNEDDSSVEFNGWHVTEQHTTFSQGQEQLYRETTDPLYPFQFSGLNHGISIDRGDGIADIIPFDQFFETKISAQAFGAGVLITKTPLYARDHITIRPIWGVRYIQLKERFGFYGIDSGAEYDIVSYAEGISPEEEFFNNRETDQGGSNTATGDGVAGRPVADSFNDGTTDQFSFPSVPARIFTETQPYSASLSANTKSNMAGPEVGLRLDTGGDTANLSLQATAGLMVINQHVQLGGYGFFNHFEDANLDGFPDGGDLVTGAGDISSTTNFNDSERLTHVAPSFEASVNFEIKLFESVPVFRNIDIFEDASFKVGYSYLYLGQIARPTESVSYVTFPANPRIDVDRTGWDMQSLNLGIDFHY